MHIPELPNHRDNPRSLAALLHAKLQSAKITQKRLGDLVGAERTLVNRWTLGGEVPSLPGVQKLIEGLALADAEAASWRLACAWARMDPEEVKLVGAHLTGEVRRLTDERDSALADAKQLRTQLDARLDAPEIRAAIEAAVQQRLATRADVAEATLAVEVSRVAGALPGLEADVIEGLLALVATACDRADHGPAALASTLIDFRSLDDLSVRHAVLDALTAATAAAHRAAANYADRSLEFAERHGAFAPGTSWGLPGFEECIGSAFHIPHRKMPEDDRMGNASTIAKEGLRFRINQIGRSVAAAGPAAWNVGATLATSAASGHRQRGDE